MFKLVSDIRLWSLDEVGQLLLVFCRDPLIRVEETTILQLAVQGQELAASLVTDNVTGKEVVSTPRATGVNVES